MCVYAWIHACDCFYGIKEYCPYACICLCVCVCTDFTAFRCIAWNVTLQHFSLLLLSLMYCILQWLVERDASIGGPTSSVTPNRVPMGHCAPISAFAVAGSRFPTAFISLRSASVLFGNAFASILSEASPTPVCIVGCAFNQPSLPVLKC